MPNRTSRKSSASSRTDRLARQIVFAIAALTRDRTRRAGPAGCIQWRSLVEIRKSLGARPQEFYQAVRWGCGADLLKVDPMLHSVCLGEGAWEVLYEAA